MVKCRCIVLALLTAALLGGCRTPDPTHAPTSDKIELVDLSGTLKLIDGTPVRGADITLHCGTFNKATHTGATGRFAVAAVPEGACTVSSTKARVEKHLRISKRLLGDRPKLRLEVPAQVRVVLAGYGRLWVIDWPENGGRLLATVAPGGPTKMLSMLEFVPQHQGRVTLKKAGCSTCKPRYVELRTGVKLPVGQTDGKIDYLTVERVSRLARMPRSLRPPPRASAFLDLQLKTLGLQPAALPTADRLLLLLTRCDGQAKLRDELNHLSSTYRSTGLSVVQLQTARCGDAAAMLLLNRSAEASNTSYRRYLAPDAAWALNAKPGDVVIVDRDGKVLFRQPTSKQSGNGTTAFDDAISFLDRTWPALAARRRISVTAASSVKTAEAVRLTEQVDTQLKAAKYPEAHRLLDRLVQLDPELAEARKLRALVRARLGDYTGAMQEVTWWRTSFGSESAEELEDQVKQASKDRLGTLRVTR